MLIGIVIIILVIIYIKSRQKTEGVMTKLEKDIKNVGDKIVDGVKNFSTTNVSNCPNCGAGVTSDTQRTCEYCGTKIPRKNRFK